LCDDAGIESENDFNFLKGKWGKTHLILSPLSQASYPFLPVFSPFDKSSRPALFGPTGVEWWWERGNVSG